MISEWDDPDSAISRPDDLSFPPAVWQVLASPIAVATSTVV
jgi:hypothetical protein